MLRELRLTFHKEPRDRYANNENQPDIVVYDTEDGVLLDLDISSAHPCKSDTVRKSLKGCAAAKKRNVKFTKYAEQQIPGIGSRRMIAIIYKHFGLGGSCRSNFGRKV